MIDWAYTGQIDHKSLVRVRDEVISLPKSMFDRYQSPFESKWTFRDKKALPEYTLAALHLLEEETLIEAQEIFDVHLSLDEHMHYWGLFIYYRGDQLSCHIDAGIHPISGKRKHVTSILYLGGDGDLELWDGDNIGPKQRHILSPNIGNVVVFENNDRAWHSAAPNETGELRIVLTTSFMSEEIDRFDNKRQRAYFVPRPGEAWTKEMYELRDRRADTERYAEAYRA